MICPKCREKKKLGSGGVRSIIARHYNRDICLKKAQELKIPKTVVKQREQSTLDTFKSFFGVKKPNTVPSAAPSSSAILSRQINADAGPAQPTLSLPDPPTTNLTGYRKSLHDLAHRLQIPAELARNDFLAAFDHSPASYDVPGEDIDTVWEQSLSSVLHAAFRWGEKSEAFETLVAGLDPRRLMKILDFITYWVDKRRLGEGLIEARVLHLLTEIEKWSVSLLHARLQSSPDNAGESLVSQTRAHRVEQLHTRIFLSYPLLNVKQ